MLDVTLNNPDSRRALLEVFFKRCHKLPHGCNKKIAYGSNIVSVWKDEEYDSLFDVTLSQNGLFDEKTDHFGVHSDALEILVEQLLFQ